MALDTCCQRPEPLGNGVGTVTLVEWRHAGTRESRTTMVDTGPLGKNLRESRRRGGYSQEELAERSNLSVSTIRKIEQGGSARIETLHTLARTLGIETSSLFGAKAPEPVGPDEEKNKVSLLRLRQVLTPGIGINGKIDADSSLQSTGTSSDDLRGELVHATTLYHADEFESMALILPEMILTANSLMQAAPEEQWAEALKLRANVYQLVGWFLTQVRQYDLAYVAIREAIADAVEAQDRLIAAAGAISQCWLFIRQGRFVDAETLAGSTASQIEPRISSATVRELSAWGWLLLRGSAAAVRNNREDVSDDFLRLAEVAAVRIGNQEGGEYHQYWSTFDIRTVRMKKAEALMVTGDARGVLRISEDIRSKMRNSRSDNHSRHLLDVASAHASLRDFQDSIDIMISLRENAPEWLRHQRKSQDILSKILRSRKRRLTRELRELANFLNVTE